MSELSVAGVARNWSENPRLGKRNNQPSSSMEILKGKTSEEVSSKASSYANFFTRDKSSSVMVEQRKDSAKEMTSTYYDLVTDFYQYGWGDSFHFCPVYQGRSFQQCLVDHEYCLSQKLNLKQGTKVLDLGCGVGGPARNIARYSEAEITGLNVNEYQIKKATKLTSETNLQHLIKFDKGDFNDAPYDDNSFDVVYAIEATCHSYSREKVYGEAFRVLKPGGMFGVYEWAMTDKYNASNPEHKQVKEGVEEGDSLPELETIEANLQHMKNVGFEIVECTDLVEQSELPWYQVLDGSGWSMFHNFRMSSLGRWTTHAMISVLEWLHIAPAGSRKVHTILCSAAESLVKAGKLEIFTPMLLFVAKKPSN